MNGSNFKTQLKEIALPVTIQCLMQSSLSLIDQIMIGRLGSSAIAGIGLAGKFTSLFSVIVMAIVTAAEILISQYRGSKNDKGVNSSFFFLIYCSFLLVIIFSVLSLCHPVQIMHIYSSDPETIQQAAIYLKWRSLDYFPTVITLFLSSLLRNMNCAKLPAFAGVSAIIANTIKGKGVSFMENQVGWHGKAPNDEEYALALEELRK